MARCKEIDVQTRLGARKIDMEKVIYFPRGLMGFESRHEFTLLQLNPGAPFLVLQSIDDPALGLLVADPYTFFPDYRIRVGNAEQSLLRIRHIGQVAVLVTVSIPPGKPEKTTINLVGPILVNHEMRVGLQVPQAEGDFPTQLYVYKVPPRQEGHAPDVTVTGLSETSDATETSGATETTDATETSGATETSESSDGSNSADAAGISAVQDMTNR